MTAMTPSSGNTSSQVNTLGPKALIIECARSLNVRRNPRVAALVTVTVALFSFLLSSRRTPPILCPEAQVSSGNTHTRWWCRHRTVSSIDREDPFSASDEPPIYFLEGLSRNQAMENWEATRQWRRQNHMGTILERPPKRHALIRSLFPTSMYQYDREGNVVVVEKWGLVNADEISRHNIKHEEMIYSYMYDLEWLWRIASPKETDKITLIMDVKGVSWEAFTAWETIRLIRDRINIGCSHYPNRAAHILMINVPSFFSKVYRVAQPWLSPQTRQRVRIMSEADVDRGMLKKIIAPQHLLPEYGGKSKVPFGQSSLDLKLKRQVTKAQRRRYH